MPEKFPSVLVAVISTAPESDGSLDDSTSLSVDDTLTVAGVLQFDAVNTTKDASS